MREDFAFGAEVPAFTLNSAGYRPAGRFAGGSRVQGNLSFSIGDAVVAEIGHDELMEGWKAAGSLSPHDAASMTVAAGERLSEILACGLDAADLTEAVTDAAVLFLLAMKRKGISDPKRIPACTVMWNGQDAREHVLLGA
jgi:hypothetical protein